MEPETLTAALIALNQRPENGGNFAARLVREAAMPRDYLISTEILPLENRETYSVDAAALAIFPTMAGFSGMDSTYAPVGAVASSSFMEETTKITGQLPMLEKQIREVLAFIQRMKAQGADALPGTIEEIIGFTTVLSMAVWDTTEHMGAQALFTGELDLTFNGKALNVDYGVPAENKQATRTGTSAYDKGASTFWADQRAMRNKIGRPQIQLMSRETFDPIVDNPVNAIFLQEISDERVTSNGFIQRYSLTKRIGNDVRPSEDVRDRAEVWVYQREGTVIDKTQPTGLKAVPFIPTGTIANIGATTRPAYRPGRGAMPDLQNRGRLGYTHVGPTTEGGNRPGPWARVYQPEARPMMLQGEIATNRLPVIETPEKLFLMNTQINGA